MEVEEKGVSVEPVFRVPFLPLVERSYRANLPPEEEQNQVVWQLHVCTGFDFIYEKI